MRNSDKTTDSPQSPILLSVCVAIYNVSKYLEECLTSLSKIKVDGIEFLLINDGSTDNSRLICEKFVNTDRRFRLINHSDNLSLIQARRTGIKNAKGEYLFFLDGDDKIITEVFEELLNQIKDMKVDILQFGVSCFGLAKYGPQMYDKSFAIKLENKGLTLDQVRKEIFVHRSIPWNIFNKIYRRKTVQKCLTATEDIYLTSGEDAILTFFITHVARSYSQVPLNVYRYRIGSGISKGNETIEKFKIHSKDVCIPNILLKNFQKLDSVPLDVYSLEGLKKALFELTVSRFWRLSLRDFSVAISLLKAEGFSFYSFTKFSSILLLKSSSRLILPRGSRARDWLKQRLKSTNRR